MATTRRSEISDLFEHCKSSFVENNQRFVRNLTAIARGLPIALYPLNPHNPILKQQNLKLIDYSRL
eukprot:14140366-Heterocapsa_arctica.AAC.1